MGKRKQLYETVQALEARNSYLTSQLTSLSYSKILERNKLNPDIINSASYELVMQQKDAIQRASRYITNIPELHMPSDKLEYLIYFLGSPVLYREDGRPWIGTFAKSGSLNGIGGLSKLYPIDLAGKQHKECHTVVYENTEVGTPNPCVIIQDYTGAWTEDQIIPACAINSVSISDEALVYRQMRNSILLTAKKAIGLVENESQRSALKETINDFINNNDPVSAIVGDALSQAVKFHNLDTKFDIDGYLRAIETYRKDRANFNGISTRPMLEKKEREITAEVQNDNNATNIYLYNGHLNRCVQLTLAQKHGIISEWSCEINPLLKECNEEKPEKEKKENDTNGK